VYVRSDYLISKLDQIMQCHSVGAINTLWEFCSSCFSGNRERVISVRENIRQAFKK